MRQINFMAADNRLHGLSEMGDPLERAAGAVDWEVFRPTLEEAFRKEAKGPGGAGIRAIGIDRAIREIAMTNLAYNLQCFAYLAGAAEVAAT